MAISKSNHHQPWNIPSLSSFPPPESYDPPPRTTPSRRPRPSPAPTTGNPVDVDVATWQANVASTTSSLSALHVSTPTPSTITPTTVTIPLADGALSSPHTPVRRAQSSLPIRSSPLDTIDYTPRSHTPSRKTGTYYHTVARSRSRIDRASLTRRESLLHGTPGTRRRQRWENARMLNNPWAAPPLPKDWMPGPEPARRRETLPYHLAGHWDGRGERFAPKPAEKRGRRKGGAEEEERGRARRRRGEEGASEHDAPAQQAETTVGHVPRELRQRLKKARGAKGLMRGLEERVRGFLEAHAAAAAAASTAPPASDDGTPASSEDDSISSTSTDDELVFVGRVAASTPTPTPPSPDALIHSSPLTGGGPGAFARWLVHAIAGYYGLRTWSVTVEGRPGRREAYVGLEKGLAGVGLGLPRPLWVVV